MRQVIIAIVLTISAWGCATPAPYMLSDKDAGYNQAAYDACMDSVDGESCE